jgi:hypothetical protein
MPQYFPETVKALASTCIDYIPPAENWIELDDLIKINPVFEYQVNYFQYTYSFTNSIVEGYCL